MKAIKEREKKASIGPWEYENFLPYHQRVTAPYPKGMARNGERPYIIFVAGCTVYPDNMKFIAHAREDIPNLIAKVEQLEAILKDVRRSAPANAIRVNAIVTKYFAEEA